MRKFSELSEAEKQQMLARVLRKTDENKQKRILIEEGAELVKIEASISKM